MNLLLFFSKQGEGISIPEHSGNLGVSFAREGAELPLGSLSRASQGGTVPAEAAEKTSLFVGE